MAAGCLVDERLPPVAEATGDRKLVAAVRSAFPQLPSAQRSRRPRAGRAAPPPPSAALAGGVSWACLGGAAIPMPGSRGVLGIHPLRPATAIATRAASEQLPRAGTSIGLGVPKARPTPGMHSRMLRRAAPTPLARDWLVA